ncbi:MAG: CRISPR-associated helicase Cas3' [Tissierellia bacterium]|jgi:CRISPR-associated endonuclease/helicase Cas3|nr:CRISPR-associated helicase Cas3' [Tissierellia bacterium]
MNTYFWAKKSEKQGRMEWLPLIDHLEDTCNVMEFLWEHWLSPSQQMLIAENLEGKIEEGKALAGFLGAIHDISKATPAFQMMKGYMNSEDLDIILIERLQLDGFGTKEISPPLDPQMSHHSLGGYILLNHFGIKDDIASIVGAHHGVLNVGYREINQLSAYPTNYYLAQNKNSPIYQKWDKEQRKILKWALEKCGYNSVKDLPSINQPAQVILAGLLIMADWVASNEEYFPLLDIFNIERLEDRTGRVENGLIKWYKNQPWNPRQQFDIDQLYLKRFNLKEGPRNVQRIFAELIDKIDSPGIFILEAPMGSGKTEAALIGAEQLAAKLGKSGLFFGLPTRATSDGMFPRIKNWLNTITKEEGNLSLRLNHGKSALNPIFNSIASNIEVDQVEGTVTTNAWFSGRKTSSLDDFVVGTVDHFLLTALRQKHLAMRHLGFSKKVVIIDEVHSYDAYMNQYLYRALEWMGAYNVPVIILSATLPEVTRIDMTKSYLKGKNFSIKEIDFPHEGLATTEYPLVTYTDGNKIRQEMDFEKEQDTVVKLKALKEENLTQVISEALENGAIIGLIVNTVKRAQTKGEYFESLFGYDKVEILHSNFIDTERVEKEQQLLKEIGKGAKRPNGKLIIGTQVIEQSLDIDFDLLISELAPMDLLIQRVGRLHRHNLDHRPKGLELPVFYVLGLEEENFEPGSEAVYGGYLLARTKYFLDNEIKIPGDISPLVQKVYDENLIIDLGEKYEEDKKKHEKLIEKKKHKAKVYRLDKPKYKSDIWGNDISLINWTEYTAKTDTEEEAYAQVRDINETIEVIAMKKIGEGYGTFKERVDLSQLLSDKSICKKIATQTIKLPIRYGIDEVIRILEEYNANYLTDWQDTPWLKGSLGIIFDEGDQFEIGNHQFTYDERYGLLYERR